MRSLVNVHHQSPISSLELWVTGCAFLTSSAGPTHTLTTLPLAASHPIRWPSGLTLTCDRTTGSKKTLREMRAGFGCATASDGGAAATAALVLGAGAGAGEREEAPQARDRLAASGAVTARTREDQWLDIRNVTVQQPLAPGKTGDAARPPGLPRAGGGNSSDGPAVGPPMSARFKSLKRLPRDLLFVLVMSATLFVARAS